MAEITLYQFVPDVAQDSISPPCTKVHRVLGYKGLPYRVVNVRSLGQVRRLNPAIRKLPVLGYDGALIPDSSFILRALEERHPTPPLFPEAVQDRALCHLLEDWADESLYWFAVYYRWAVVENYRDFTRRISANRPLLIRWLFPPFARRRVLGYLHAQGLGRHPESQIRHELSLHLERLCGLLGERTFLLGERLCAADLAVFAPLQLLAAPFTPKTAALVRQSDRLWDWMLRVDRATRSEHTARLDQT